MNDWSLVSEYFALILLAVIALFLCDSRPAGSLRKRRSYYWGSLGLSALSILLNILTVFVIENIQVYSVTLAVTLNTLYFLVSWSMITVMVYYLFLRILEFIYEAKYLRFIRAVLFSLFGVFTALLLYNLCSGVIFSFDASGSYVRGPLNAVGFVLPVVEVILLLLFYFIHRRNVGFATQKVLFVAAPISILLILYQTAYPDQLLNGAICALVNLIIFISYQGGLEEQDALTGLDNRRSLMTELIHRADARQSFQLILIKLRSLPRVNRIYGQNGGNTLLFQLGEAMQSLSRNGRPFRYSDEEFVLLYEDTDEQKCKEHMEKVIQRLSQRWRLGLYETSLTFSTVELIYKGQNWSIEDICGYLSDAAHIASTEEIVCYRFSEKLFRRHQRREYVLRSMHTALQEGRFRVWYQPVYYHNSGCFESAEALLRMVDELGEPISPSEFIPIAEETGLVDELTDLVLHQVCALLSSGDIPELKSVSINVPMRQVIEVGLQEHFRGILTHYGIRPEQIRLEITERDVEEAGHTATEAMRELSREGFRFMLDDFGIGYSNLSRVLAMPLESIKLDRSLVLQLDKKGKQQNIIRNHIIPLFRKLGQSVVAEGVEDAKMAELVLGCEVDRIQGFYYARPMPTQMLVEWYAARQNEKG